MPVVKDVLIGLPIYDNRIECDILQEMIEAKNDLECVVAGIQYYNGDSLIPRGRNKIAKMFLETDCKYLMFIDSDIKFNRWMINKLRAHDKGIVGGVYLKKTLPYQPVMNSLLGQEGDLAIMREIGTGFMMIRRDVFGAFRSMWPENDYTNDDDEQAGIYHDWFKTGVFREKGDDLRKPGRYLSEDYYFCQEAAQLGYKTYLDRDILTQHVGKMSYPTKDENLIKGATVLMNSMRTDAKIDSTLFKDVIDAANKQLSGRADNIDGVSTLPIPRPFVAMTNSTDTVASTPLEETLI
jgi:hypothetical protein